MVADPAALGAMGRPFRRTTNASVTQTTMQLAAMHVFTTRRRDFSFLERTDESRHGLGVLEFDGFHARGPTRPSTPPQNFRPEFFEKHILKK